MNRTPLLTALAIAGLLLLASCARLPTGVTSIKAGSLGDLQRQIDRRGADLDEFSLRGPFQVTVRKDHALTVSGARRVEADLYLSPLPEKAPLVILLHGQDNSKDDHGYQGMHLASWGMHALVLELPNQGPWIGNGRFLASVVEQVRRDPGTVDARVDPDRIILAGHSYGGAAVAVALGEGAAATGGVLLDPAGTGRELIKYLGRINKPVMVLGADEQVSSTRNRRDFYRSIRAAVAEVSIQGAAHEDAEFPLDSAPPAGSTESHQLAFVGALTAAAYSLAFTGRLDSAWSAFGKSIQNGKLVRPQKK